MRGLSPGLGPSVLHLISFTFTLTLADADLRSADDNCDHNKVVFDQTDSHLDLRTIVVEDQDRQRVLVLTNANDTTQPCYLEWWLEHNPQGTVKCVGAATTQTALLGGTASIQSPACAAGQCVADTSYVELGYVRTMLASVFFVPQEHVISTLCIELGCRTRIRHARFLGGSLLATSAGWIARPQPKRVLVIGLGSSTMALWLRHALPATVLEVAELAPGVAAAAPCFGLTDSSAVAKGLLKVSVDDGRDYLQRSADGAYDAILVDAFDANASLPACFRTREFFALAQRKLAPGGAMSLNLLLNGRTNHVLHSLVATFSSRVWVGKAPGAQGLQNIVTAFNDGHPSSTVALEQMAHSVKDLENPLQAAQAGSNDQAKAWLAAAKYHLLQAGDIGDGKALDDATECPFASGSQTKKVKLHVY